MFYDIEIPRIVEDDIFDLTDYIYRFTFDKNVAKEIYDELYKNIFTLDFLPNRYEKYLKTQKFNFCVFLFVLFFIAKKQVLDTITPDNF